VSIINFTVQFDVLSNREDGSDSGSDTDIVALSGPVTFTALFGDEKLVLADNLSPRAAGLKLRKQSGWIDTDGRLKTGPGGAVGVRLWANDPIFDLDRLVYQVDFDVRTPLGERVRVAPGFFEAPTTDTTVNLVDVLETSASGVVGASPIASGTLSDRQVFFVNADGSAVAPIDIPSGVLVFVDNGDSTWSVE